MQRFTILSSFATVIGMILFMNCMGPGSKPGSVTAIDSAYLSYDHHIVPYTFYKPDSAYELDDKLNEISGLTTISNDRLAAIEDERGVLYILNTDGSLNREIKFDDEADYEGVEYMNNTIFVLESDGDIYQFPLTDKKKADVEKFETDFTSSNDTEGFGQANGHFLVASKSDGDVNDYKADGKTVFRMSAGDWNIEEKPFIDVTEKDLEELINIRDDEVNITDYDPSAIAVSPIDGRIYLLSADMILAVFSPEGKLEEVVLLLRDMFRQPEGICFTTDGTLYIASEANGGKPQLLKFSRITSGK